MYFQFSDDFSDSLSVISVEGEDNKDWFLDCLGKMNKHPILKFTRSSKAWKDEVCSIYFHPLD